MNKINPISYFPNPADGRPLSGGKLYIGLPDADPEIPANQKQVYTLQENGSTVAIPQPIYLSPGGTPIYNGANASLYVSGDYSIKVKDFLNAQRYYIPDSSVDSSTEVSVYDTIADMTAANTTTGALYKTKGYYTIGDGGGGTYLSKTAADYGGTPDGYGDHYDAAGNVLVLQIINTIHVNQFGAVPFDSDKGIENYNSIRAALKYAVTKNNPLTTGFSRYLGSFPIEFGAGIYHVKGKSVFALSRTELEATSGGRYRVGVQWKGQGRMVSVIVIQNTGEETWAYDNRDSVYPSDASTADHVQFDGMTIKSEAFDWLGSTDTRKYKVAAAQTINGFYFVSNGWEKMSSFNDVVFEGFDGLFSFNGTANCDQHTFVACQAMGIIDYVFYINNDQSVANRIFGMDCITYGNVFKIGPKGGGDFLWEGGSITQYPKYSSSTNLPDNAASALDWRGFFNVNLGDTSSGASLALSNSNYNFRSLRFENYDDYNHLVIIGRTDIVQYGRAFANFDYCTFLIEQDKSDLGVNSPKAGDRNLVYIDKQQATITFNKCGFSKNHKFTVNDVGSTTVSANATIKLTDSFIQWQPDIDGSLKKRFSATTTISDCCNANFIAQGIYSQDYGGGVAYDYCDDFNTTASKGGPSTDHLIFANIKQKHRSWPNGSSSTDRLYLPEGAVITSVFVNKTSVGSSGSATYRLLLVDYLGNTLWTSGDIQEQGGLIKKADLTTPHLIGASPNNYVMLWGQNGSVDKGKNEVFLVGYFTAQNS